MADTIEERLAALNLELPSPAAPVANYAPFMINGPRLYISGQMPVGPDGIAFKGHVGSDLDVDQARQAARLCAINVLAQAKAALGDLERIEQCLKLGGFISCTPEFIDHPQVVNGASDLIVEVLGEKGRHSRLAVGVSSLPLNAAVEVEALFAVK
jgi:enamine deaminase RidA (YjgF/YER057c/UK114 family)